MGLLLRFGHPGISPPTDLTSVHSSRPSFQSVWKNIIGTEEWVRKKKKSTQQLPVIPVWKNITGTGEWVKNIEQVNTAVACHCSLKSITGTGDLGERRKRHKSTQQLPAILISLKKNITPLEQVSGWKIQSKSTQQSPIIPVRLKKHHRAGTGEWVKNRASQHSSCLSFQSI